MHCYRPCFAWGLYHCASLSQCSGTVAVPLPSHSTCTMSGSSRAAVEDEVEEGERMADEEEEGEVSSRPLSGPVVASSASSSSLSRPPKRPLQISLQKGRGFHPQFNADNATDARYAGKVRPITASHRRQHLLDSLSGSLPHIFTLPHLLLSPPLVSSASPAVGRLRQPPTHSVQTPQQCQCSAEMSNFPVHSPSPPFILRLPFSPRPPLLPCPPSSVSCEWLRRCCGESPP